MLYRGMVMDGAVIASWVGAAASLTGSALTVWWPWRNRPQASWFIQKFDMTPDLLAALGLTGWQTHDGLFDPDMVLDILNDGDGPAFNITLDGTGIKTRIIEFTPIDEDTKALAELPSVHAVGPGEKMRVLAWLDSGRENVSLRIHWILQPTRIQKRVYHEIAVEGGIENQPWEPIPESSHEGPNLIWYRLAHSRPLQWLYGRRRILVRRAHAKKNQQKQH